MPATNFSSLAMNGDTPGIFNAGPTGTPTMGDPIAGLHIQSIQATAAASTDASFALPYGARIVGVTVTPSVTPTGTTVTLAGGTTQGGTDLFAATNIKVATQTTLALALGASLPLTVANFASLVASSAGGSTIWLRIAQTGQTAVGTATVNISYVMA